MLDDIINYLMSISCLQCIAAAEISYLFSDVSRLHSGMMSIVTVAVFALCICELVLWFEL